MAPFLGPGRAAVIKMLRAWLPSRKLPITLGVNQPQAVIDREPDGTWTLRPLVLDVAASNAAGEAALARGDGWMPEMTWRFLSPGAPLLRADSAAALADAIVGFRKWSWGD
jgi:hypothetical protein